MSKLILPYTDGTIDLDILKQWTDEQIASGNNAAEIDVEYFNGDIEEIHLTPYRHGT